jgi:trigger factor
LRVEVPFDEFTASLEATYKKIAQQINVPGFRRGKVPAAIIDRQVGRGAVLDEAVNEMLPKAYLAAVKENALEPVARPEIEVTKLEDHEVLEFTAEVDIKPEIELPDYHGLEARVDDVEVSDADLDEQVQAMRERFGALAEVERPAADGDFVTIDLEASQDGKPVEGAQVAAMSYRVGRGGMLDGLDEALAGMSAGDQATFSSELVGGDLIGEAVQVLVAVSAVQEQELPEVDDDFVQQASEFDTVEEFSADLRERLGRGKRLEQAAAARDAVLEVLLDQVSIPVPGSLITDELTARRQGVEEQLAEAGLTMAKYLEEQGQSVEEFEADLERRVRDSIVAQFLLDEVAEKEQIGIEQTELSQHVVRRAQQAGQDPQQFANHMLEHNHIPDLVQEIRRGKALAVIVEAAVVKDASGNLVELANLQPDGSISRPPEDEAGPAGSADAAEPGDVPVSESPGDQGESGS